MEFSGVNLVVGERVSLPACSVAVLQFVQGSEKDGYEAHSRCMGAH